MSLLPEGILKVSSGDILFDNTNLAQLSEAELEGIRGNEISMIFQEPMTSLNPLLQLENRFQKLSGGIKISIKKSMGECGRITRCCKNSQSR